jgi:hypothetical protein
LIAFDATLVIVPPLRLLSRRLHHGACHGKPTGETMSDLNAGSAVPVAASIAALPSDAVAVMPAVTPAPVVVPVTEPAAPATVHERVAALPHEHVSLLHDILAHLHEGFTEFSLMTGMSRLGDLFAKAKSML